MSRFNQSKLAIKYLEGLVGLEIGGSAHNAFGLNTKNVDYTDDMETIFKKEERKMCGSALPVDVVAEGDQLPFEDNSVDFVISSHVIEHFFDPIKAIKEWLRVSRKYVFMIVPHRDRTFDRDRELTPVDEFFKRHIGEIAAEDPRYGIHLRGHWSVWNAQTFKEMCDFFEFNVETIQDPDDKVGNGFSVILRVE